MSPAPAGPAPLGSLERQSALMRRLLAEARAAGDADAQLIETHISFVLLAGGLALKVKKAVALGFVDFGSLERRRFFCDEELRLNRRLAPALYLDVVPITGTDESPRLDGSGPVLEWAVRMHAFPQQDQWDRMIRDGRLERAHVDRLAQVIADFHRGLAPAPRCPHGEPARVLALARDNLDELERLLPAGEARGALYSLRALDATDRRRLPALLDARNRAGYVRECHGDLHLANIAQVQGDTVVFDCIDFNEAFRWIDVAAEIAFPVMDLRHRGRPDLSARLLDRWLAATGDYAALGVIPFYLRYRALVRAKVSAIRAAQAAARDDSDAWAECRSDLALALWYGRRHRPLLVVMHGLSGSGKTVVSERLVEIAGAVRVRSDLERKRAHGLAPTERGGAASGLYSSQASADTYELLAQAARHAIAAGTTIIVDATFLARGRRQAFRRLALGLGARFVIVDVHAPEDVLRARVVARATSGHDASDADLAVLERQLATIEAVADDEADRVWRYDAGQPLDDEQLRRGWAALAGAR